MTGGKPHVDPLPYQGQSGEGGRCPFCGASVGSEFSGLIKFICGTVTTYSGGYNQKEICKDRQIAQLKIIIATWESKYSKLANILNVKKVQEEIAQLLEKVEAWREFWRENIHYVDKHHHDISGHLDRLKELKEI